MLAESLPFPDAARIAHENLRRAIDAFRATYSASHRRGEHGDSACETRRLGSTCLALHQPLASSN